jgi:tetratricopeptide (TPR) repeat protein
MHPRRDSEAATKCNQLGFEAMTKGKIEKAEKYFKEALVKDIDFGPAHNNLGRLYFDQGKNYLAAWEFEYAIKVMPKRGEPYNNLGIVLEQVGKLEQAIDAYEMANLLCPNNNEVVGNLARIHWSKDKYSTRTRELLEQIIFIDSRPDWIAWAKEQVAYGNLSSDTISPPPAVPFNHNQSVPLTNPRHYPTPILPPPTPIMNQNNVPKFSTSASN